MLDDEGNAQAVKALYGDQFVFCEALGWMTYTGTHWERQDAEAQLDRAIVETLIQRQFAAMGARNGTFIKASEPDANNVRNTKYMLTSLLRVNIKAFDQSPDHLNVANGVLDLRTGALEPHRPQQRFTYCLSVPYNSEADTTAWQAFLQQVVGGGDEVVEFLQMAVGYAFTGHTREEKLFYISGPTRSGKGTFTETVLTLLGKPLAVEVDFNTFTCDRDNDANNYDLAPLKPARCLVASESGRYHTLNAAKIKLLTGGNEIRCCYKYRDHFEYRPAYKIWLVSNHDIHVDPDDDAAWGRLVRIEFPHSFYGHEDTTLKERMKRPANLQAVLAWAVEGAKRWYGGGLQVPTILKEGLRATRTEQDIVQQWLDEHTEPDPESFVSNAALQQYFFAWCAANGHDPLTPKALSQSLKAKGYQLDKRNHVRGVLGLCIA